MAKIDHLEKLRKERESRVMGMSELDEDHVIGNKAKWRRKQENKARQIFRKTNMYVCVSGSKKCSFFGKFGVLSFIETSVLRFALLPYYQRCNRMC